MNFYDYLPHEYSYALNLAYIYDLHPYDSMILNMVSERYPRDEDEDCASAYDSESCEEDESCDVEILNTSTQDLESSTSQNSILFGSFTSSIIPVSIPSITPYCDGFSIKIGEITCFLGDSCCSDVDFIITASEEEEEEQLKAFETEFAISQKLQNPSSVQVFSSPIKVKRQNGGNVGFSQDHDQTSKKGEMLYDLLLLSSESITFIPHHCDLGIIVFDPRGVIESFSVRQVLDDYRELFCREPQPHNDGEIDCVITVFDPGGTFLCHIGFCFSNSYSESSYYEFEGGHYVIEGSSTTLFKFWLCNIVQD